MDNVVYGDDAAIETSQNARNDLSFPYGAGLPSFGEFGTVASPDTVIPSANFGDMTALSGMNCDPFLSFTNHGFEQSDLSHPYIEVSGSMPPPPTPIVTNQPRKRITNELWATQKGNIRELFISQGLTLSETMKIMEETHQFSAS
jgi:hypothetical protein